MRNFAVYYQMEDKRQKGVLHMTFGEKMKECRLEKGLTLQQIAEKLGVSESTVQRYESGQIKKLSQQTLNRIAKALGVTQSYLLGELDTIQIIDDPNKVLLTNSEQILIRCYRSLRESERSAVRTLVLAITDLNAKVTQHEWDLRNISEFMDTIGERKAFDEWMDEHSNG